MKKIIPLSVSVAASLLMAACGGSGSDSPTQSPTAVDASGTVSMTVPLKSVSSVNTSAVSSDGTKKPTFIDGNSNGSLQVFFDGLKVLEYSTNGVEEGAGPSGNITLSDGGSFNYTSTITLIRNQPVATITGSYTTTAGNHTIGAVQVNGACDPGVQFCLAGNQGYVLAQGQAKVTLQAGKNKDATLYMRGVMQSVYICDDDCDGHEGKIDKTDGLYHLYVVVADENGTAIPYQTDAAGKAVTFDNGAYQLVEVPPAGQDALLSIMDTTGADISGTWFQTPGQFRVDPDGDGSYGIGVNLKCNKVGDTKLIARLGAGGGTPVQQVTGFTTTPGVNYPTANMELGSVGANQSFGNQLTVHCSATGNVTIK